MTEIQAIKFAQYGHYREETFVEQEVYRTITAGVSPYLSQTRGIMLKGVKGEVGYDGEYMTPVDSPMQSDYRETNIEPFLSAVGRGADAIEKSIQKTGPLRDKLSKGNVTLAEQLSKYIEGKMPKQDTPSGPVPELQSLFMAEQLADSVQGIGTPTHVGDVINLKGKRGADASKSASANPADVISNAPGHAAIIKIMINIAADARNSLDWYLKLASVKFLDITESGDKKWIVNQIKQGVGLQKRRKWMDPDNAGSYDEKKIENAISAWRENFTSAMDKLGSQMSMHVKGLKALKQASDYSESESQKILKAVESAWLKEGGSLDSGEKQNHIGVANHLLNVWNLAFREYIAAGHDTMPAFMEQQPIGETGYWAAIIGVPYIKGGTIGFDWDVEFIDVGSDGAATDAVIIAEYASARGLTGSRTAQEFLEFARWNANQWAIHTVDRAASGEEYIMGLVDNMTQPELNIELMPDAKPGGLVGPITRIASKDVAKALYRQIIEAAKTPGYAGPFTDLYEKMIKVANDATQAWKLAAGNPQGNLFAEALNDYKEGGIWPDDGITWKGNVGRDLGVSPFLLNTKEYVKIFGGDRKAYNVTLGLRGSIAAKFHGRVPMKKTKKRYFYLTGQKGSVARATAKKDPYSKGSWAQAKAK